MVLMTSLLGFFFSSKKTSDMTPEARPITWDGNYQGELDAEGQRTGKGVYHFTSGDVYRGEWNKNQKEGYGIAEFVSGSRYEGNWYQDMKHGHGRFDFGHDGSFYIGDWVEDRKHGWGTAYFRSGNRYEGDWDADRMHGVGKFLYFSGDTFEGAWDNNRKNGFGVWTSSDGNITYAGEWLSDFRHGDGILCEEGNVYFVSYANGKLLSKSLAPPCIKPPRPVDRSITASVTPPPKPEKSKCLDPEFETMFPTEISYVGRDYVTISMPSI